MGTENFEEVGREFLLTLDMYQNEDVYKQICDKIEQKNTL